MSVATQFFVTIRRQAQKADLLSNEHFSVDGTLIEAWASMKSFRPRDDDQDPPSAGGRNAEVDFKGQRRKNDTHQSTTDPDCRLLKKGKGKEAKLCFMGHALMENRNGLVVDSRLTQATGKAEREAALEMVEDIPRRQTDNSCCRQELRHHGICQQAARVTCNTARYSENQLSDRQAHHPPCRLSG